MKDIFSPFILIYGSLELFEALISNSVSIGPFKLSELITCITIAFCIAYPILITPTFLKEYRKGQESKPND